MLNNMKYLCIRDFATTFTCMNQIKNIRWVQLGSGIYYIIDDILFRKEDVDKHFIRLDMVIDQRINDLIV